MRYMLLINHGANPDAVSGLSKEEQKEVGAEYQAINQTPGVTPGLWMEPPEAATTVRVKDKKMITTDGPFTEAKEALGGWLLFEGDFDAALELASRIPAARLGGAVEVRPLHQH